MDIHVFLFTDILLLTKAKKNEKFKIMKPVCYKILFFVKNVSFCIFLSAQVRTCYYDPVTEIS